MSKDTFIAALTADVLKHYELYNLANKHGIYESGQPGYICNIHYNQLHRFKLSISIIFEDVLIPAGTWFAFVGISSVIQICYNSETQLWEELK